LTIFKGHDKDRVFALIDIALESLNDNDNQNSEWYTKIHHLAMVGILIVAFCKDSIKSWIRNIYSSKVRTGLGGNAGNKGGTALWFELDDTSLVFCNCHLESGQSKTYEWLDQM
jgi:phosphatidylinositol-bisphosphatase